MAAGLNLPQRALLRLLKPLVPALRLGNGLKPEWISRDRKWCAPTSPTRWCTTA